MPARLPRKTIACEQCGKSLEVKVTSTQRFCSPNCRQQSEQIFSDQVKTCVRCGKEFTYRPIPSKPDKVCCSRTCSNGHRSDLHNQQKQYDIRQCAQCGNEFEVRFPGAICCSVKCSNRYRSVGKKITHCQDCGKPFEHLTTQEQIFCSTTCRNRFTNQQRFGPRRQLVCVICGKVFSPHGRQRQSKCCSVECRSVYYSGPNSPTWKGGWSPYYGPNWRKQRRKARDRDNDTCQHCGITGAELNKALDVHHLQPFRTFNGDHISANRLENLITLCPVCHKLAEFGHIAVGPG